MKVFISVDMEGICGLVHDAHVSKSDADYQWARKLMTAEASAAVEGALTAGAGKVVVNDSHASMRNILPEELHPEALLISGSCKPMSMMQGFDKKTDAVAFVGYHAMRGVSGGVLCHTYSGVAINELRINGRPCGEFAMNAYLAGYYGVPSVFVSGDDKIAKEAASFIPGIVCAVVKKGIGFYSAENMHPSRAQDLIMEKMATAVGQKDRIKPLKPPKRIRIEVDLVKNYMVDVCQRIPGVKHVNNRTIAYTCNDYQEAYNAILTIFTVAG